MTGPPDEVEPDVVVVLVEVVVPLLATDVDVTVEPLEDDEVAPPPPGDALSPQAEAARETKENRMACDVVVK